MHADKICVVMDGKIVEEGKHQELLKKNGEYKKLYNKQFELAKNE
jgi:ABC-type multidrug transport system fused ATPase/permease subunit